MSRKGSERLIVAKKEDVLALIDRVGEERLQEELDKRTWLYIELEAGRIALFERYRTEMNPVEWLVYNNVDFLVQMAQRIVMNANIDSKDLVELLIGRSVGADPMEVDLLLMDAIDNLSQAKEERLDVLHAVWNVIKSMNVLEFVREILAERDHEIHLLNANGSDYLSENLDATVDDL